jgi:transposase
MYKIDSHKKLQIVRYYKQNNTTLHKTAKHFGVHYQSVYRWVKQYRKNGKDSLDSTYRNPHNRKSKELEEVVISLKEQDPTLTVRKARKLLCKEGYIISIKGIWSIWKRYGYTGYKKENLSNDFTEYIQWSQEAGFKFERAKDLYKKGKIKESAKELNSISSLPKNELLNKIPDKYLNVKRRTEKMALLFGNMKMKPYKKKLKKLFDECIRKKLYYSALRVGILTAVAHSWSAEAEDQLRTSQELRNLLSLNDEYYSKLPFPSQITMLISDGTAYGALHDRKRTKKILSQCRKILKRRKSVSPHFLFEFGIVNTHLENFKEAEFWYKKALEKATGNLKRTIQNHLSTILSGKGEYTQAKEILGETKGSEWEYIPRNLLNESLMLLAKGVPHRTIELSIQALSFYKKRELKTGIFNAHLNIASAYCSLGETKKGRKIMRDLIPFLEKHNIKHGEEVTKVLLSEERKVDSIATLKNSTISTVRLALLLREGKFEKALSLAKQEYLIPYYLRYIFFFPISLSKKYVKRTSLGLSNAVLNLPFFEKSAPSYNIGFLGELIIHKNQIPMRVGLSPKDTSVLIHLVIKVGEPEKKIELDSLLNNFWPNCKNPRGNLSHLLVRIKQSLGFPSHLLAISRKQGDYFLVNRGIHFITDYNEFKYTIVHAKAFKRAGEWELAKTDFKKAFKLFRGEPFRKMYDNWSDDRRLEILFTYESEVVNFAQDLISRNEITDARTILNEAKNIIPFSDEIDNLLNSIRA